MNNATAGNTAQDLPQQLNAMHRYFESGATRSYAFRREQLLKLKAAISRREQEIYDALYTDLKKNKEEAYATEIGLIFAEITVTLRNLRRWMAPQRTATDLVNLPSKTKIYKDPLGVVLIISPWNYPLQLLLIPLVGAIAGGNCVVIKPSELAPATAAVIEKIIADIFLPAYVQVVQGDGARVIPEMMNAFRFDHIFYTGSITVGKSIYQAAAKELIPVTLELGGKSPAIVEAGADIASASRRIVLGKFVNAGQTCIAPDYLLVHESLRDQLLGKMVADIEKFYTKDASQSYEYGKIINDRRFDKLVTYLSQGTLISGGQYNRSKLFIAPTLITDVPLEAPLMKEEIFGPLLPVFSFTDTEAAMKIVHHNPNPLAFYLFTSSTKKEKEWISQLSFGGGCINNTAWHFSNHHIPFGGVATSGLGAYHGKYTFDTFTRVKPVMKTPVWFDPAIKYPPFKGKLKLFRWLIR